MEKCFSKAILPAAVVLTALVFVQDIPEAAEKLDPYWGGELPTIDEVKARYDEAVYQYNYQEVNRLPTLVIQERYSLSSIDAYEGAQVHPQVKIFKPHAMIDNDGMKPFFTHYMVVQQQNVF